MEKRKFRIGDRVKVIGMSPVTFAPGVKDELDTEKLFKSMLGKVYTVRGFDKYGNIELEPKRLNPVWVDPEFLKLRASARRTQKHGPKSWFRHSRYSAGSECFAYPHLPKDVGSDSSDRLPAIPT